jgi:FkbM family methyltransferase
MLGKIQEFFAEKPADGQRRISVRGRFFNVTDTPRHRKFWTSYQDNTWETDTFDVMDRFLGRKKRSIDIGGWIGPTALYAAAMGARVTVFEPDNSAYAEISKNIAANPRFNDRINLINAALSTKDGTAVLHSNGFGNSQSSLVSERVLRRGEVIEFNKTQTCKTLSVERAFDQFAFADADLIKIDIEGGEYPLLPKLMPLLKGSRVPLFVSFHANNIGNDEPTEEASLQVRKETSLRMLDLFTGYTASHVIDGKWVEVDHSTLVQQSKNGRPLWGAYLFRKPKR